MLAEKPMDVSVRTREQIKSAIEAGQEYVFAGATGGARKQRYWTPDGRVLIKAPNMRDFVVKDATGNIIEQGTRDANLDNGLLTQRPQVLKLFCPTCDRWHDTLEEVAECKRVQDEKLAGFENQAQASRQKENQDKDTKIDSLERQIAELTTMIKRLAEK